MGIYCYTLRVEGGAYSDYTLWGIGGPYSARRVAYDTSDKDTKHISFLLLIYHHPLQKEIWKLVLKTIIFCPIGLEGCNHVFSLLNLYMCWLSFAGWT